MDAIHHRYWVIGRSLIRTFLAGATKDAAICLVSEEQAQKKKMRIDLALSKEMITFEPDDEAYYGWWHIIGCSLKAVYSRMWN